MTDWSQIIECPKCGKGNPKDFVTCLACGHQRARPAKNKNVEKLAEGMKKRKQEIKESIGIFFTCAFLVRLAAAIIGVPGYFVL